MNLVPQKQHHTSVIEFIRWYQEPGRYYHNLDHINDCLRFFQEIKHLLVDSGAVWMAIWFHDCVYSTLPNARNEEMSAAEMRQWVKDEDRKQRITRMILVTKHSVMYPPMSSDECFMCDIDMAILGADRETYETYSRNIRLEYSRYSDTEYNTGRLTFLNGALNKARQTNLYYTSYFKSRFTEQAKLNLTWEITQLQELV